MILEYLQVKIRKGFEARYEAAFAEGLAIIRRQKGNRHASLTRSVENPGKYVLIVGWDTLDNHMVDFRESGDFQTYRDLVMPYYEGPPVIEHISLVRDSG